jgi:peptide/nickel transport system substrate-binding protein
MEPLAKADVKRAQQLLKESGYDGTPVVILQPTDLAVLAKLPMVAAQSLRQAGFKVDLQSMDWSTLLARRVKKDPAQQGGWSVLATAWPGATYVDPMVNFGLAASCEKAWPGWPCDPELEKLRDAYAATDNPAERKTLAEKIQVRAMETVTYVPLGEFGSPPAVRRELKGFVPGYYFHAWNVERVGP